MDQSRRYKLIQLIGHLAIAVALPLGGLWLAWVCLNTLDIAPAWARNEVAIWPGVAVLLLGVGGLIATGVGRALSSWHDG